MNELDFDEVLQDWDSEENDSEYDPDEEYIECIECDEIGDIIDVLDVPYNDLGAVTGAALKAGFHFGGANSSPAMKAAAYTKGFVKKKKPAKTKPKVKVKTKVKVKAKAKAKAKVKVTSPLISSALKAAGIASPAIKATTTAKIKAAAKAKLKAPVIKPGTKPAKILKKLKASKKITAKLTPTAMEKVAVAMASPAVAAGVVSIPKAVAPYIAPTPAPISFPIPATSPVTPISPVVSKPVETAIKVTKIRKAKKMPSERPKKSISFVPGKKHEMVCLGQSIPRRLYELVIDHNQKKLKVRKKRALECAGAYKATEAKLTGQVRERTTELPKDYIKIACGLPA